MLDKIIEYSIRNRFLILFFTVLIVFIGIWALYNTPLDAIPDLSDVQVIVLTEFPEQAPQVVEDQVTYPLTTTLLSVPGAKVVRGYSFFGISFVYVIFEDGTDIYWARSRVLEYLNSVTKRLPEGVIPTLGPDASGVGWIYEYALIDKSGKNDLARLRGIQDWYLRYGLTGVEGVAEVASIGGFVKQYQIDVDPNKLMAYNIPISMIMMAIKRSNRDTGGGLLEMSETQYMVRGLGYIKGIEDIENIPLGVDDQGSPILVKDVASVHTGPELRRGAAELNGTGEAAGGIVVMRSGQNALAVIERVKKRIEELKKGLPDGVEIVPTYDRSTLIEQAVHTLIEKLMEESLIVALVCIIFLLHFRSAFVAIFTLPLGILMALIVMNRQGLNANIMSLGGIAIAIGAMIDAAIVMIESAHKHIEHGSAGDDHWSLIVSAARQVGPALFFSLLIITFSFLPIFTLQAQEGRLFSPLAYTKTYAMAAAAMLSITFVPVMMGYFIRTTILPASWGRKRQRIFSIISSAAAGIILFIIALYSPGYSFLHTFSKAVPIAAALITLAILYPQSIRPEHENPVNRVLIRIYRPVIHVVLRYKTLTIILAIIISATLLPLHTIVTERLSKGFFRNMVEKIETVFPLEKIGGEFMPPLYEGDLLYMPTTYPGISITKAKEILQQTDRILMAFHEVSQVFGKVGRADTATDPGGLSMVETIILLKPRDKWRTIHIDRFYEGFPSVLKRPFRWILSDERRITPEELTALMDKALKIPGLTNAWTMPIKTRIDMLATGIKTPIGIKVMGSDLTKLNDIGLSIESILRQMPGTLSAYSERIEGEYYLDFNIDRINAARFGLTVGDIQDVIESAVGGMNVSTTIEGLERYPISVRYGRELRDNLSDLARVLIPTPTGAQIPISQVANISIKQGSMAIKSENSRPSVWIFVDIQNTDIATYVKAAKEKINSEIKLPAGYNILWSGQYEYMERANRRLMVVVPLTILIIFLLLYLNFKNVTESLIVMLSLPFAIVGGVWFIYLLGYNMSIAVGVGFIALCGVAAETGVVMLIFLDEALRDTGGTPTRDVIHEAVIRGAVDRVRPKIMTVTAIMAGLLPLFWGEGAGADTMRRIAAPMIGGMVSSTILTLIVIPAIYTLWKERKIKTKA